MMKEKKMFIIHTTVNVAGGVGTVIKNLIASQISEGYKVGLAYIDNGGNMAKSSIYGLVDEVNLFPLKRLSFKGRNILNGMPMKQLYLKIKTEYPDYKVIIHAHNPVAVGLLNNISIVPMICTIHGINPNRSLFSRVITKLILYKLEVFDKDVIAVSDDTARYYNQKLNSKNIRTIRNGVSINKVEKPLSNQYFTIGYTSYIDELKGWRCLFDAYLLLLPEYKDNIKLVFAGDGPQSEVMDLKNMIKKHKVEDNVKYLGFVNDAGNSLMPYFDLFVLPSKSEGIPMTILEAIGHSVPVLATSVGGIPEVIKDGVNGFLLSRDPIEFSRKIKKIVNDPKLFKLLKKNAFTSYHKEFSNDIMCKKYEELYSEI